MAIAREYKITDNYFQLIPEEIKNSQIIMIGFGKME